MWELQDYTKWSRGVEEEDIEDTYKSKFYDRRKIIKSDVLHELSAMEGEDDVLKLIQNSTLNYKYTHVWAYWTIRFKIWWMIENVQAGSGTSEESDRSTRWTIKQGYMYIQEKSKIPSKLSER